MSLHISHLDRLFNIYFNLLKSLVCNFTLCYKIKEKVQDFLLFSEKISVVVYNSIYSLNH